MFLIAEVFTCLRTVYRSLLSYKLYVHKQQDEYLVSCQTWNVAKASLQIRRHLRLTSFWDFWPRKTKPRRMKDGGLSCNSAINFCRQELCSVSWVFKQIQWVANEVRRANWCCHCISWSGSACIGVHGPLVSIDIFNAPEGKVNRRFSALISSCS